MIVIVLLSCGDDCGSDVGCCCCWLVEGFDSGSVEVDELTVFTTFVVDGGLTADTPWVAAAWCGVVGLVGGGVDAGVGVTTLDGTLVETGVCWAIAGIVTVTVFGLACATELLTIMEACGIVADVGTRGGGMLPSAGLCKIGRGTCVTTTCCPCGVTATIFCGVGCAAACGCNMMIVLVPVPCCCVVCATRTV